MTGRLRAILGGSNRVKKKKSVTTQARSSGHNNSRTTSPPPASWSNSLPRSKAGASSTADMPKGQPEIDGEWPEDYNPDEPLPNGGLVHALLTDLTLRDVPQAMRYSHNHMFTPIPDQPSSYGLSSTRVAEVLNFRRNLPHLTTTMHLHALLRSPTAVERETAELMRTGTLRKVVILRRGAGNKAGGGVIEFLIEEQDLETMVNDSGLPTATKLAFKTWLKVHPGAVKASTFDIDTAGGGVVDSSSSSDGSKASSHADHLVRAGFLTNFHGIDFGHISSSFARPEDYGTMLSLHSVSRAAAGSTAAVGGSDALHGSGGSGVGGGAAALGGGDLSLAVPGQGAYLKLLTAAVSHLTAGLLAKAPYREMPEGVLRERWDGGVASEGSRQHAGKKSRREFSGVLPGRTRKWKQFHGLAFEWVLHEAVGAGLVEVFETGSVGRGVRLL